MVNPPVDADGDTSRLSLVFFHNPNHDAQIASRVDDARPKCAPTTSGEHLQRLFTATQNPARAAA